MKLDKSPTEPFERVPIYKVAHDLIKDEEHVIARMNKAYKFTTGKKLQSRVFKLADQIALAYMEHSVEEKIKRIDKVLVRVKKVLICLRVINDLQMIDRETYGRMVEGCISITKQGQSWLKKVQTTPEPTPTNPNQAGEDAGSGSEFGLAPSGS